jgi:hypothetical protein
LSLSLSSSSSLSSAPLPLPPSPAQPSIIWLYGPRAVGKSTIGYHLFTRLNRTIAKSAYLDLAQIAFCHPASATDPDHHHLKATTMAAMWDNFRSAGAQHLVITGTVAIPKDLAPYRASLRPTRFTLARLDASADALTNRLASRAAGSGPAIPGDTLRSCTPAELRDVTARTLHEATALQPSNFADLILDTTHLSAPEAADTLFQLLTP